MDQQTAAIYRHFGEVETVGISEVYSALALGVAEDADVVALIARLPGMKRQANLVFGSARFLGAPIGSYADFRAWLLQHWDQTAASIMSRATQTNEAGRCAVLLPVLSRLPQPLSLIEVGASAGLCLYPDRYSYGYSAEGAGDAGETIILDPSEGPSSVVIPCVIDAAQVPQRLPMIAWRAGVDLNPIDPGDTEQIQWLKALIWPEQHDRRQRLVAAARIAAADPVPIVAGDLVDEVETLIAQAPPDTTVVVFHTAVLAYLAPQRRRQFVELISAHPRVTWISNEGPEVLPEVTAQVNRPIGADMILAVDAAAVALTAPHGGRYRALR